MKSVVLLSGGLDSTVLLASRRAVGDCVIAVSFDYGQTHGRELDAAKAVARYYGVEHRVISLRGVFGASALLGEGEIPRGLADGPDATEVPGRNLVLLSIGAAIAAAEGASSVLFGANADDFGGYPDCRHDFIQALDHAVGLGNGGITIAAPFQCMTKAQVVQLGIELNAPLELSWSCYRGADEPCEECGACESRNGAIKWRLST